MFEQTYQYSYVSSKKRMVIRNNIIDSDDESLCEYFIETRIIG